MFVHTPSHIIWSIYDQQQYLKRTRSVKWINLNTNLNWFEFAYARYDSQTPVTKVINNLQYNFNNKVLWI